jgi:hypothetical protein
MGLRALIKVIEHCGSHYQAENQHHRDTRAKTIDRSKRTHTNSLISPENHRSSFIDNNCSIGIRKQASGCLMGVVIVKKI